MANGSGNHSGIGAHRIRIIDSIAVDNGIDESCSGSLFGIGCADLVVLRRPVVHDT